jgi:uncharacterized repeat protein (TIGR01451 family)
LGSTAHAFGTNECAPSRYGADLGCTAADVSITGISVSGGSISSCVGGSLTNIDLDLTVNSAVPQRYDIGIFIANDGNSAQLLPANGGAATCSVGILPPTDPPFRNHDGPPDTCGDVDGNMNGGTGTGVLNMTNVTVACRAVSGSGGNLYIPFVVSWDQQASPTGAVCTSNADPVPGTKSKCNAPTVAQSTVSVVVLPSITKTDGIDIISAGSSTTYTVVITNTTGDTLSNAVFTDPVVTNLTVNSVACAAAGGATCPATTITDMQGSGITIPAMPVDSSVTFTIDATLSGTASGTLTNTANVTVSGETNSASDVDTILSVDHFSISHDGSGINCQAEEITITAHDSSHNVVSNFAGTVTLTTSTNHGDWSKTIVAADAFGTLTPGASDSGSATYTFVAADNGSITLNLSDTYAETISINLAYGAISETSNNAIAADDPFLTFDATGFNFLADSSVNAIGTQISGKASNVAPGAQVLELQAIKTSDSTGACETALNGNKTIQLAFECLNPATCTARQVSINGTNIAGNNSGASPLSYTGVALNFGGNNDDTATFILSYPDAGLIRLHARYVLTPSGAEMLGSSNDFVVRPFGLGFTDIRNYGANAAYDDGDDVLNPGGTAAAGSGFIAAEDVFRVSLTAYQYDATDDTDVDGIPDIGADITDNGDTPNFAWATSLTGLATNFTPAGPGGAVGSMSGTTAIALADYSSGSATSSGDLRYAEVGSMTLQALAADYITSGIDVYGYSPTVGRFFPDHFTLTASSITAGCGGFTYMDQPSLGIDYNLQARSLLDNLTANYDQVAGYNTRNSSNGDTISLQAEDNNDGINLAMRLSAPALVDFVSGNKLVSTTETFSRAVSPDGPYQGLQLSIQMSDEQDGRNITGLDQKPGDNNDCVADGDCNAKAIGATTDVRYGRFVIDNAFGSELLDLVLPLHAEYYTGSGFIFNADDGCSTYNSLNVTADYTPYAGDGLDPGETTPTGSGGLINGNHDPANPLYLTAPGAGNDGSVDITLDVGSWLEFDWNGSGDEDPGATATFGIFKGNDATIYLREIY